MLQLEGSIRIRKVCVINRIQILYHEMVGKPCLTCKTPDKKYKTFSGWDKEELLMQAKEWCLNNTDYVKRQSNSFRRGFPE